MPSFSSVSRYARSPVRTSDTDCRPLSSPDRPRLFLPASLNCYNSHNNTSSCQHTCLYYNIPVQCCCSTCLPAARNTDNTSPDFHPRYPPGWPFKICSISFSENMCVLLSPVEVYRSIYPEVNRHSEFPIPKISRPDSPARSPTQGSALPVYCQHPHPPQAVEVHTAAPPWNHPAYNTGTLYNKIPNRYVLPPDRHPYLQ